MSNFIYSINTVQPVRLRIGVSVILETKGVHPYLSNVKRGVDVIYLLILNERFRSGFGAVVARDYTV